MAEPLPPGVEGRRIGNRHPYMEIIAAAWLRYVDGDLATGACQALLVRAEGRSCEEGHAALGRLLLEYQTTAPAGRVWFCLDCAADARDNGEFTLEWTHKV